MIRAARLCALALALALPALAQTPPAPTPGERDHRTPGSSERPIIRTHRSDPAPSPGTGEQTIRTHRTPEFSRALTPSQPVQWEIPGAKLSPATSYPIFNLRRAEQGRQAQLSFREVDNGVGADVTGWSPNGGVFEFRRPYTPGHTDLTNLKPDEFLAIYNTKTKRFMYAYGKWSDGAQYIWQLRGLKAENGRISFSLYNLQLGRYLVLKDASLKGAMNGMENDLALIVGPLKID